MKPRRSTKHEVYSGISERRYNELINAQMVNRACDEFFRNRGLPVSEVKPFGGYGSKKKP